MPQALTDRQRLKDVQIAQLASNERNMIGTARAAVNAAHIRTYNGRFTDAGTAGTGQGESPIGRVRNAGVVRSVNVSVPLAVVADNTDYISFTVSKRTAGGAAVTIASGTTQVSGLGALTAFLPLALTLAAAANLALAAGDVLTVTVAKGGAGKAMAAATTFGVVTVDVEED